LDNHNQMLDFITVVRKKYGKFSLHSFAFHVEDKEKMQIHATIFLIFFIIM